jgi:hypothetical protein
MSYQRSAFSCQLATALDLRWSIESWKLTIGNWQFSNHLRFFVEQPNKLGYRTDVSANNSS